jgi:hypothetical protein
MSTAQKDEQGTHSLYWEALAKAEPDEVCKRTEVLYNEEWKGYILPVFDQRYLVSPEEKKILCFRGDVCEKENLRNNFYLMALLYLLNAKEGGISRNWISEKELKGGTTFFRGPHALQTEEVRQVFGKDPDGFARAGRNLGGVELLFGDKAFTVTPLPKIPLAYVLWKEDQEFPSQVTVMFDSTIQNHFSLDGVWCLVAEASQRILDARNR